MKSLCETSGLSLNYVGIIRWIIADDTIPSRDLRMMSNSPPPSSFWLLTSLSVVVLFGLLYPTISPSVAGGDSGELIAQGIYIFHTPSIYIISIEEIYFSLLS
jgi:hypothetical protein